MTSRQDPRGREQPTQAATPPLYLATAVLRKFNNAIVNAGQRGVDPRPLRRELNSVADQLDLADTRGESPGPELGPGLGPELEDYQMWAGFIRALVPLCDLVAAGDSAGARTAMLDVMRLQLPESFPGREKWL